MENYHRRPKTSKAKFEVDIIQPQDATTTGSNTKKQQQKKQTTQEHNRPQQHGVMVITLNGKVRTYVTRALEILTEADNNTPVEEGVAGSSSTTQSIPNSKTTTTTTTTTATATTKTHTNANNTITRGVLTLKAQGKSITKAVTVAEILKRRLEGSLHQFTEIGQITEREVWDPNPDQPNLDPITISKHRPTIRIRLSKELPTAPSSSTTTGSGAGDGMDMSMPGANIPRNEHADDEEDEGDDGHDDETGQGEAWPGAILDRDAAARRFVGYQAPTGNDIYL
ncbi:hypothetical protein BGZ95_007306 [Linnemannia exigua]|uniref:DNA/RNA-binding protein Alba-like domain-containing protein n=1 Tax=Linnemannia exigua TaxID=604196 RepID=A0AAD4DH02_9FUNG|nr:hypothetical protein BGZ95_007306 [Linnemannia exigua]